MSKKQAIAILSDQKKLNELAKMAFDGSDTDHSGYIDIAEMKDIIVTMSTEMGIEPPNDEDIQNVISHLDKNKNDRLEFEEFKVFIVDLLQSVANN